MKRAALMTATFFGVAMLAVGLTLGAGGAFAAGASDTVSSSASVTLLDPVSVTETQALSFGRVIRPPSVPELITVFIGTGTAGSTATLVDGQQLGSYTVTGDASATIRMFPGFGTCSDPGTKWKRLNWNPPITTSGSATLQIGGEVEIQPTAASGTCAYTVTAQYE